MPQHSVRTELSNPYGYYDEEAREYVITRPDTPSPWMNYLGEGRYGGIISNTAGGFSFDRDPKNRRISRYRYNSIPADQPGRYVYLRDQETNVYWSPTWQPVTGKKLGEYECRHGAGYTRISSRYRGISARLLYFVPFSPLYPECPLEVWSLTLENKSRKSRTIRSFSYVELSFWDALNDLHNLDWAAHILSSRYQDGTLLASTRFRPTTTFFSSSQEPLGFDSDREVFTGRYRSLADPLVVVRGEPCHSEAARGNNISSLVHEWTLEPGESTEIRYLLGVTDRPDLIKETLDHYRKPENVRDAFDLMRRDWDEYLSVMHVETPDPQMNATLNFWNPVQCRTTLYWSRFVSAYETGLGRGMGTRDSAQDTFATVQALPGRAVEALDMLWKLQFADGHTWHQVYPLTGEGGPGLAGEFPDWPQWFCDDHLWLVLAVCAYLRETGDFSYLDRSLAFYDSGEESTVWEHIQRAVDFTLQNRGPHRLPRLGFSDWDDTMNLDHGSGKAESVWCAQQFCRALLDLEDVCRAVGKGEEAKRLRELYWDMSEAINECAWDGSWYVRAYDDDGLPVGAGAETNHQIGLNTQTWAVIGEASPLERAVKAMENAHEKLNSPYGLALMWPPYTQGNERVRGTSTYPPGAKENGGIFCHANTWAVIAAARLGWGERAFRYYRQILPLARPDVDLSQAEPYVYCSNICSREHPQYGYARNSWLTGTASWAYVAGTQWILGIRPTFQGLKISPVLPDGWKGFHAVRVFRGVTYRISVECQGRGKQVSLDVNGEPVEGDVVPLPKEGVKEVEVRVRLV
jgi:cellobiose phosphorylase